MLCTWRLTVSRVNDADGVIYVKLTVKIVNYAVNCQSLVTVTPLFTIVIYGAIFEWRRMCTTLTKIRRRRRTIPAVVRNSCVVQLGHCQDAWQGNCTTMRWKFLWCQIHAQVRRAPAGRHRQNALCFVAVPWLVNEDASPSLRRQPCIMKEQNA